MTTLDTGWYAFAPAAYFVVEGLKRRCEPLQRERIKNTVVDHRELTGGFGMGMTSLFRPAHLARRVEATASGSEPHLDRFFARLEAGAATYGDASFTRPATELVDEVQQELEDVFGWSLLLWIRLERLKARVAELGNGETHGSV